LSDSTTRENPKMRAIVYGKYGPAEVLQLRDVEEPTPRKDEILIQVQPTTVRAGD
jgi:NADPH:quinone reductase-like Zn-dependent oxidoreductase